ncbi:hypothetical protein LTR49_022142 [Elasticomyces elasticus]|nr:hypothetical protein LTR49_022142 [Elasticomyces elasticus]
MPEMKGMSFAQIESGELYGEHQSKPAVVSGSETSSDEVRMDGNRKDAGASLGKEKEAV